MSIPLLLYPDLINSRLKHLKNSYRLKCSFAIVRFFSVFEKIFRRLCRHFSFSFMPFRSSVLYSASYKELSPLSNLSSLRSLFLNNQYLCSERVNLSGDYHFCLLEEVIRSAEEIFDYNHDMASFLSATTSTPTLISHHSSSTLPGEIYRFVQNPLLFCPSILKLLISPEFESIFRKYPSLRLAGTSSSMLCL